MPQKKNPDVTELIRGKTGRVYGDLNTLLVMMKGLPLAYNKDMQEDKEAIFDAVDTLELRLRTITPMLDTMKALPENMRRAAAKGFINATDCADYLTKKGLPFRDAYKLTGCMVADCIAQDKTLEELTLEQFQQYSPLFAPDIDQAHRPGTLLRGPPELRRPLRRQCPAPDPAGTGTAGRLGGGQRMSVRVFIDGSSGTTGLRIADRLAGRAEIQLLHLPESQRKELTARADAINSADLAFLCLPDAASREILPLLRPDVKVLDTSTAFRTAPGWVYGFPELRGQKAAHPAVLPGGSARLLRQRLHRPGTAPGGAGAGAAGVSLQLHRLIRVQRRRQKDDRCIRKPGPPLSGAAGRPQELRPGAGS